MIPYIALVLVIGLMMSFYGNINNIYKLKTVGDWMIKISILASIIVIL